MKKAQRKKAWVVTLICVSLGTPRVAYSVEPANPVRNQHRVQSADVRLDPRGALIGQLLDTQGRPASRVPVELWRSGERIAATATDADGRFGFAPVTVGVYQVLAAEADALVVRAWQPATAPPAASDQLLLVRGSVVRGQYPPRACAPPAGVYDGAVMRTLSNPWVFSGLVAAGIAIPIALANDDDDRQGS
jgi:hypothetical protein